MNKNVIGKERTVNASPRSILGSWRLIVRETQNRAEPIAAPFSSQESDCGAAEDRKRAVACRATGFWGEIVSGREWFIAGLYIYKGRQKGEKTTWRKIFIKI